MFTRTGTHAYYLQTPCQLRGSDGIMKAIEEEIGVTHGHTTKDKMFTFTEVECLGACVNAPMVQINDDFYEDLTPETTKSLLKALRDAAEKTGAGGMAPGLPGMSGQEEASGAGGEGAQIPEQGRGYAAQGVKIPAPGPFSGRQTCEPSHGLTSLKEVKEWDGKLMRTDGALD
jgi:NADH dehydrogenase (ubiquinone) flavoprotein 2